MLCHGIRESSSHVSRKQDVEHAVMELECQMPSQMGCVSGYKASWQTLQLDISKWGICLPTRSNTELSEISPGIDLTSSCGVVNELVLDDSALACTPFAVVNPRGKSSS